MAKFIYRMQNILDVKIKLETQAKNEFAIANARLVTEEEKLNSLVAKKGEYEQEIREMSGKNLDLGKLRADQEAIDTMKYLISEQEICVKQAERNVEDKRIKLSEAMKERKTHEKLKEKQFEQFLLDLAAQESKEIDELVSYRFGQK